MLCDQRLRTRAYGRIFLDSLPPMPRTERLDEVEQFLFAKLATRRDRRAAVAAPGSRHEAARHRHGHRALLRRAAHRRAHHRARDGDAARTRGPRAADGRSRARRRRARRCDNSTASPTVAGRVRSRAYELRSASRRDSRTARSLRLSASRTWQRSRSSSRSAGARILVCMDARMNEVYWGRFEATPDGLVQRDVGAERVDRPEAVEPRRCDGVCRNRLRRVSAAGCRPGGQLRFTAPSCRMRAISHAWQPPSCALGAGSRRSRPSPSICATRSRPSRPP